MKIRYVFGLVLVVMLIAVGAIYAIMRSQPTMPNQQQPQQTYVALGDSVAAGIGIGNYTDSSACNRSNGAYGQLIATAQNFVLRNFACSGATIPSGITGPQTVNRLAVSPQLERLFAEPQTPQLITITIGANDARWTDVLSRCYTQQCGGDSDRQLVNDDLQAVTSNLAQLLRTINDHYDQNKPRIMVTGYYQVFPAEAVGNCIDLSGLDPSEQAFGRELQTSINSAVQAAVNDVGGATFVPIDFSGHELCSSDPWVQGLADKAPYHPTAAGQQAIATSILKALGR